MATTKNKKLLNPRGYISWSQVDMWIRNRERYVRIYMLGEPDNFENPSMTFGKRVAQAREDGDGGEDSDLRAIVALMPQYAVREHEIRETLHTPAGDVDLLGKLDNFDPDTLAFRDDKTGVTRWTQRKAEKHKQLHHYATLVYLRYKKAPREAYIDWAETQHGPGGTVSFTGHIESFRVPISMGMVLEYMSLVGRVAREIDEEYRKQMKSLT